MNFNKENIKVLHLELTTRCNAACPQCARTDPSANYTQDFDLSLDQIKEMFDVAFIRQLDKVLVCGLFGDPAAAVNALPILTWFREVNPTITLGMNTNGGIRNSKFWSSLGNLFNQSQDFVVFSIDGLQDTNHIYRVNVQWTKVMQNAATFISAGGAAHWDMLIYEHNKHQVEKCKDLAKEMGFSWFRGKVSSRFEIRPVLFLQPPAGFTTILTDGPVMCDAWAEKSLYVAATGKLMPCCHLGDEIFRLASPLKEWIDEPDFKSLTESLHNKPINLCQKNCGSANKKSRLVNQFQEVLELKNYKSS